MSDLHHAFGLDGEDRHAALVAVAVDEDTRQDLARHLALERVLGVHLRRRDLAPLILARLPATGESRDTFTRAVLRRLPPRRRRWLAATGAALAAVLLAAVGWALWRSPTADNDRTTGVLTATGTPLIHRYADGSTLTLAAGRARITTTGAELLHGRLHARVAARTTDEAFVIRSPGGSVQVIGTAFSLGDDGARFQVDVEEGRVRVDPTGHMPVELGPDEGLSVTAGTLQRHRLIADFESSAIWDRGAWTQELGQRLFRDAATSGVTALRLELVVVPRPDDGRGDWAMSGTPYRPRDPAAIIACDLRVLSAAPGASWGLHLGERDGDSWMMASGQARPGDWFTVSAALDQAPQKRLAFDGDGRFDPTQVDRLSVSISGAPCVLLVDRVIERLPSRP